MNNNYNKIIEDGLLFYKTSEFKKAKEKFEIAYLLNPERFDAVHLLGLIFYQNNQLDRAKEFIEKSLKINSDSSSAHLHMGVILKKIGKIEDAIQYYKKAILLNHNFPEAYSNLGNALMEKGEYTSALENYESALLIKPEFEDALFNKARLYEVMKNTNEAIKCYSKIIEINPKNINAIINLGNIYLNKNICNKANELYDEVIKLDPDNYLAYANKGIALLRLNNLTKSIESYDRALLINNKFIEGYFNKGNALMLLNKIEEAIKNYIKVIDLDKNYIVAYCNIGVALIKNNNHLMAIEYLNQAIKLNNNYGDAYLNKAQALKSLFRYEEAISNYEIGLKLNKNSDFMYGSYVHLKMIISDWVNLDSCIDFIIKNINKNQKIAAPFPILSLIDDPKINFECSQIYSNSLNNFTKSNNIVFNKIKTKKIRIGYYSADYYNHATSYLIAELFEKHDRNKFEIYGFTFIKNNNDQMHKRIEMAVDKLIDVTFLSDTEIVQLSIKMEIDIAIDLKGYTQNSRPGIFIEGCAPIQINFLGYPGTSAIGKIDYIIADEYIIPNEYQSYYSEKIMYLPNCYQVNDSKRIISDKFKNRNELGLPENDFVFCCFNNNYKITPIIFNTWMEILNEVKDSVLWLLEDNLLAVKNLKKQAVNFGINENRLIFAKRISMEDHLSRQQFADLFLDTYPYNAHTTASDALWSGLPILTYSGKTFASRVAGSLLKDLKLNELIATSLVDYKKKAIELASNPTVLAQIKIQLEINKKIAPLFNGGKYSKNIEKGYMKIWEDYCNNIKPRNIYIK
jgi:predicted O-linked N-acetylglucosamine transferase (SPINDLY family)